MRGRELGAAAVLLAFGLFALTQARGLRFGSVVAPGPGFFPLCLAAALCLTSLALLVRAWRVDRPAGLTGSRPPAKPPQAAEDTPGAPWTTVDASAAAGSVPAGPVPQSAGGRRFAVIGTLAGLLVYALVLERVGFLLATCALLLFFFRALQRQRWVVAVGGSIAMSVLAYLVFKVWLGVNLPGGLLAF